MVPASWTKSQIVCGLVAMARGDLKRLVPWLLAGSFALLALAMVMIHVSSASHEVTLQQQGKSGLTRDDMDTLTSLLMHPKKFAAAMVDPRGEMRTKNFVHTHQLHEEEGEEGAEGAEGEEEGEDQAQDEEEEEEEEEKKHDEYYQSSGPSFGRKGVGPAFSMGDPVLNKKNKMIFERPCELEDECDTSDKKYYDWRNLKMAPRTANEDMEKQMRYLFKSSGYQMKQCKIGFHDDEAKAEVCEQKVARAMCGKFENINQECDWSVDARHNRPDGTYYFNKFYKLSACHDNEARDAMQELCQKAEKLPGVSLTHWPWQGFSLNLQKRGFSGDWMMGPYGWSGRSQQNY